MSLYCTFFLENSTPVSKKTNHQNISFALALPTGVRCCRLTAVVATTNASQKMGISDEHCCLNWSKCAKQSLISWAYHYLDLLPMMIFLLLCKQRASIRPGSWNFQSGVMRATFIMKSSFWGEMVMCCYYCEDTVQADALLPHRAFSHRPILVFLPLSWLAAKPLSQKEMQPMR